MASDTGTDGRGLDPSVVDASTVALAQGTDVDDGLSTVEAAKRLEKHGENKLVGASPVPAWKRFLLQFKDPLVHLLIAATVISVIAWGIEAARGASEEPAPFDAIVIVLIHSC